jgi:hypothetical protein
VNRPEWLRRHYWIVYVVWIVLCAALFFALRNVEDPSRRSDRISNDSAGAIALAALVQRDPARFDGYEAVHVAYSPTGELGSEARWVVLCDTRRSSQLRDAVVVELRASDGQILRIRDAIVSPR